MPFELRASLAESVHAMSAVAKRLRDALNTLERKVDSWDPKLENVEHPGFSETMSYPMSQYGTLEFVADRAAEGGIPWSLPAELDEVRRQWADFVARKMAKCQEAMKREYEFGIEWYVEHWCAVGPPGDEIDTIAAEFDAHTFAAMGSDVLFPDLKLGERLADPLERTRLAWHARYRAAAAEGGWHLATGSPLSADEQMHYILEETFPWLPESFWWRHLPDLIENEELEPVPMGSLEKLRAAEARKTIGPHLDQMEAGMRDSAEQHLANLDRAAERAEEKETKGPAPRQKEQGK